MNFKFPQFTAISLDSIVTNACAEGVTLLTELLFWNPNNRPTSTSALRHSYFRNFSTGSKIGQSNGSAAKANMRPSQTQPEDRATQKLHQQQKAEQFKNNSNYSDTMDGPQKGSSIGKSISTGNFNYGYSNNKEENRSNEDPGEKSQRASASRVSANSITRNSIKDQYLNRSRYITGQSTAAKSSNPFRSSGSSMSNDKKL